MKFSAKVLFSRSILSQLFFVSFALPSGASASTMPQMTLPNELKPLYCGEEYFGCEDDHPNTIFLSIQKGTITLVRQGGEGDPVTLSFVGTIAGGKKNATLKLNPSESHAGIGTYKSGEIELSLFGDQKKGHFEVTINGYVQDWTSPDGKSETGKNTVLTKNVRLSCNQTAFKKTGPSKEMCNSE